jgi:predicted Fe-Mo cluster-binding NifX family protein
MVSMVICATLVGPNQVGGGLGRTDRVAIARMRNGSETQVEEHEVRWARLYDQRSATEHHDDIARFLKDHKVEMVVTGHAARDLEQILDDMSIELKTDQSGSLQLVLDKISGSLTTPL